MDIQLSVRCGKCGLEDRADQLNCFLENREDCSKRWKFAPYVNGDHEEFVEDDEYWNYL